MGDSLYNSSSNVDSEVKSNNLAVKKSVYKSSNLVSSDTKHFRQKACRNLASLTCYKNGGNAAVSQLAIFLLKFAALETVRRVSKSKCPSLWRGIQAMQFLCYPPLKWIQKWAPFKGLVKGAQMFSRPLLFLSVVTAFTEQLECDTETSSDVSNSQVQSDPETDYEIIPSNSSPDIRETDVNAQGIISENFLLRLQKELENQGIFLPERINEDELQRFHSAANGNFSCLLSSIKKTIRWRENYKILTEAELEMWSKLVFWHGFDVENRPCLIVRLGLACASLPSQERPRFAQAVISQVEHGVLHLVDRDNAQITVLVDCDGISPLRFPMQIVRSCSSLLQDNFPNRLGHLLVIRLPPVVRVIAQTFIQVLKPVTRKKLRIEGKMYRRVICEYLQTIPSYLGGNCSCKICISMSNHARQPQSTNEIRRVESLECLTDSEDIPCHPLTLEDDLSMNENWDELLRTAIIGILMVWAFIALMAVLYDPENRPF